jgi:hypothetical protein
MDTVWIRRAEQGQSRQRRFAYSAAVAYEHCRIVSVRAADSIPEYLSNVHEPPLVHIAARS